MAGFWTILCSPPSVSSMVNSLQNLSLINVFFQKISPFANIKSLWTHSIQSRKPSSGGEEEKTWPSKLWRGQFLVNCQVGDWKFAMLVLYLSNADIYCISPCIVSVQRGQRKDNNKEWIESPLCANDGFEQWTLDGKQFHPKIIIRNWIESQFLIW